MTLRQKQAIFWQRVAQVITWAADVGTPIVILEWMRSVARQGELVRGGASTTMKSKHLDGLAVDWCFLDDLLDDGKMNFSCEKYQELIKFAESIGLRSGARFGDDPNTILIDGWDRGHLELGDG